MKVCSVCNEIVPANQRCALSNCPNKGSARPTPKSGKVTPGPTGRSDRAVQAGLDRAGDVARDATRRAAFAIAVIFSVVAAIAAIGFNLGGDNQHTNTNVSTAVEASPQATTSPAVAEKVEVAAADPEQIAPQAQKSFKKESSTDRNGNDIEWTEVGPKDFDGCSQICTADTDCVAFTVYTPSPYNKGYCWTKFATGKASYAPDSISGVQR